jgi:hypothetical protein
LVYTFNGLCSVLAGLGFALFVSSGHGLYAPGFELDVIASVVIGGTLLTGGSGYVIGTLFGVMVLAITQALIQFIGSLSSWWTKIVIGVLMLIFIGVQAWLTNRKGGRRQSLDAQAARRPRQRLALVAGVLLTMVVLGIIFVPRLISSPSGAATEAAQCEVKPFRKEEAASLIADGAVIAYHRLAGPNCVDEMYAIYPDGRITGDNGKTQVEIQKDPVDVASLLTTISDTYGWYSNVIRDTYHNPCRQCYAHYVIVSYDGQEKGTTAVDGGVNMPPEYGYTLAVIRQMLPSMPPAP